MKVFVSYSATTDSAPYVNRFCDRLNHALAERLGDKATRHVFADSSLALGDNWQVRLAEALNQADVFLALYSPLLFNSQPCGRELGYFIDRLPALAIEAPIVPVWWEPSIRRDAGEFPVPPTTGKALIDDLQHRSKEAKKFGAYDTDVVARQGLSYLIRNEGHSDFKPLLDYYLNELPARLVALALKHRGQLRPNTRPFGSALDIWGMERHPAAAAAPAGAANTAAEGSRVHFIVVAARPEEIDGARGASANLALAYRDAGGRDWRPFWPDNRYIGNYLQRIVLGNFPDAEPVVEAERDISRALDAAMKIDNCNQPLFFVLDAWNSRLDECSAFVKQLSSSLMPHTAVVVPFVGAQNHPDVLADMYELLQARDSVDDEVLKTHVATCEAELERVITDLHERIRAKFRKRALAQAGRKSAPPFQGGTKPSLST